MIEYLKKQKRTAPQQVRSIIPEFVSFWKWVLRIK